MDDVLAPAPRHLLMRAAAGALGAYGVAALILGTITGLAYVKAVGVLSTPALLAAIGVILFAAVLALPAIVLAGLIRLHLQTQQEVRELRIALNRRGPAAPRTQERPSAPILNLPVRTLPAGDHPVSA